MKYIIVNSHTTPIFLCTNSKPERTIHHEISATGPSLRTRPKLYSKSCSNMAISVSGLQSVNTKSNGILQQEL